MYDPFIQEKVERGVLEGFTCDPFPSKGRSLVNACVLPAWSARQRAGIRVSFLACPFLAKGRSGSAGSRYGRLRLWLAKERRNGVGEKSAANCGKIAGTASPSRALVAHSGRFRVDDCAVARACVRVPSFTAHGPSARATLLLLITLIAKRRSPRATCMRALPRVHLGDRKSVV